MSKPWFGVKTYGYGLSPRSWEGWVVVAVYVVALGGVGMVRRWTGGPVWVTAAAMAGLTVALIGVAAATSERKAWRWRWGGDDEG